jgi:linoleate 10R-lipoxygenase
MLDYFLGEGADHMPDIQRLAAENTDEADEKLMHYVMEGIRLNGTFGSYREAKIATTIDDGGRPVEVKPGDKIFCSFVSANRDPAIFPNPNVCDPNRPLDSYIHYGIGPHKCLGMEASRVGLTAMFKVVAGLKNLRRAPGPQGQLKYVPRPGGFKVYMSGQYLCFLISQDSC